MSRFVLAACPCAVVSLGCLRRDAVDRCEVWCGVQVWDIRSRDPLATYKGHGAGVTKTRFSPDGKMIASGDENGVLKVRVYACRLFRSMSLFLSLSLSLSARP